MNLFRVNKINQALSSLYGSIKTSLRRIVALPTFPAGYAIFGASVLFLTTLLWSALGAGIHQGNADQLANPYLFDSKATLHGSSFPGQHSFFIKWPLFYFIKLAGYSYDSYALVTVACALATVAALAYILFRIDKRPLVFGTLMLALASVLIMIPAQPYAGALLPLNMAMLATRNVEYIFYIAAVLLLIRSTSLRSRRFWLGVGILLLLTASDKLFLTLSIGGALISLVIYSVASGWNLVSMSVRWLIGTIAAGVGALGLLWLVVTGGVAKIVNQSTVGPYGLVHNVHDLALGCLYGVMGLLTNLGANPAYDSTIVRNIPHQAISRLLSPAGPTTIVNLVILVVGLIAIWRLLKFSLAHNHDEKTVLNLPARLSLALTWSSLAAFAVFVLSDHYYAVDARYLTIVLFAVFIALASYLSGRQWRAKTILAAGAILFVSILFGIIGLARGYNASHAADRVIERRNVSAVNILRHHKVDILVGDYWRVTDIKSHAPSRINILPLAGCTQPRSVSVSSAWQHDLSKHSFAYLLSFDKSQTDYPQCSLSQITDAYGPPNASTLVAGSLKSPAEMLLFYDRGVHKSAPVQTTKAPSTILPVALDDLPNTSCSTLSVMNVVAHEDDDILFMNPDLLHDIQAGHCVRTIFLTAGDAGGNQFYWLSREQAAEASYIRMVGGEPVIWISRVVELNDHEFVTIANPRGNPRISLIFVHLPDGNLHGSGFAHNGFQSLARLDSNAITQIRSVDGQSTYTSAELSQALVSLMEAYSPAEIRTQSNLSTKQFPDHSDHMAVGRFTQRAHSQYEAQQFENRIIIPISYYVGYSVQGRPENVSGADLQEKEAAWDAYNDYDVAVCQTIDTCMKTSYGKYLTRQYTSDY